MEEDSSRDERAANAAQSVVPIRQLSPGVLKLDHVYDALGHPRRRYLCYTLLEDAEWSLTDLATKIAAWEQEIPEDEVGAHQRERVYVSLYHAHVPKLVDLGVITFDAETETIRPDTNAEQVLAALRGVGASLDAKQEAHARSAIPGAEASPDDQKE